MLKSKDKIRSFSLPTYARDKLRLLNPMGAPKENEFDTVAAERLRSAALADKSALFALLAFGQLFGFLGLLIAVPTAAAIGVVARHLIALYLTSPFYRGRSEAESQ